MRREYDGTVLWGTRYKIEKISGLISQRGEAGNRTVNYCGGIISRRVGVKRDSAGTARATRQRAISQPLSQGRIYTYGYIEVEPST